MLQSDIKRKTLENCTFYKNTCINCCLRLTMLHMKVESTWNLLEVSFPKCTDYIDGMLVKVYEDIDDVKFKHHNESVSLIRIGLLHIFCIN